MDLKKKLKAFFTLERRANDGFTLVELIVVIAILAILAGVAIPAYSGYVTKAEEAADLALLDAVNTAFAAACLANGEDHVNCQLTPQLTAPNGVPTFNCTKDSVKASFTQFFAGNESAAFKGSYTFKYDAAKGAFVIDGAGATMITLNYAGGTITISAADIQKLKGSTFITELGIGGLLSKVDEVAGIVTGLDNKAVDAILESEDFKKTFLENLGIDISKYDTSTPVGKATLEYDFATKLNEMSNEALLKMGYKQEDIDADALPEGAREAADNKVTSSMAVLYAAQSTVGMTTENIKNVLSTDNPKNMILSGETGDQLGNAALYYGMYLAYANNSGNSELKEKWNNPSNSPVTLLGSLNADDTKDFKAYLETDQGKADLEAYMASMNMVTDSATGNFDTVGKLVVNGFSDEELVKLLQGELNK